MDLKILAWPAVQRWIAEQGAATPEQLWQTCPRGDWLLWVAAKTYGEPRRLAGLYQKVAHLSERYLSPGASLSLCDAEAWRTGKAEDEKRHADSAWAMAQCVGEAAYLYVLDRPMAFFAVKAAHLYQSALLADSKAWTQKAYDAKCKAEGKQCAAYYVATYDERIAAISAKSACLAEIAEMIRADAGFSSSP